MSAKVASNQVSSPTNKAVTQQLAEISAQGMLPGNGMNSARSHSKKDDPWADNIHIAEYHEDPTIIERLKEHNIILADSDKFIDFVQHMEN